MSAQIALFLLLLSTAAFAAKLPCDKVELWQQLASLKMLNERALLSEASNGSAFAQYFVAASYLDGKHPNKDESVGVWWLRQAAANDFSRAQLLLGQLYESGNLVSQDQTEALRLYTRAAEQGDCEAELFLGLHYRGGQFDLRTKKWDYRGARDAASAVLWLRRSAEHGNPDAQFELGRLYEEGDGVTPDYAVAAYWYLKAADHGPDLGGAGQGRNALATLYMKGNGVPKDYVEAYKWFALAGSKDNLDLTSARMSRSQMREAKRRIENWKQQHATQLREAHEAFSN